MKFEGIDLNLHEVQESAIVKYVYFSEKGDLKEIEAFIKDKRWSLNNRQKLLCYDSLKCIENTWENQIKNSELQLNKYWIEDNKYQLKKILTYNCLISNKTGNLLYTIVGPKFMIKDLTSNIIIEEKYVGKNFQKIDKNKWLNDPLVIWYNRINKLNQLKDVKI